jgi:hypothetical protein
MTRDGIEEEMGGGDDVFMKKISRELSKKVPASECMFLRQIYQFHRL